MDDLREHPFASFMAGESFVSTSEQAWLAWINRAEKLAGCSIDGDQDKDGYSLDFAYGAFESGESAAEYAAEVRKQVRMALPKIELPFRPYRG